MPEAARLVLIADSTSLKAGEQALDSLARTGAQVETKLKTTLGGAERSISSVGDSAKYTEAQMAVAARRTDFLTGSMGGAGRAAQLAARALGAFAAAMSIGAITREISAFETSMSGVAAVTRATTADLAALRDMAKTLGETTEFSAAQAADGLKFLGMAGFNARDAIAAIPDVLNLATAAQMDLASAADISSNIMSGFGIAATEAGKVADVLAAASSRANTDVQQLGQAMSTVAPISATLGISLQDTAAAIGVMSDAGIQGERAGTAMRGALASLAAPTKAARDALREMGVAVAEVDPTANSLADIMARLRDAGLTASQALTIFGREAASGALVMVEGADRLRAFGDELTNVEGEAQRMADTMRNNLGGDIKGLGSAVSGLMITMGEAGLTAALRNVIQGATNLTRWMSGNLTPAIDAAKFAFQGAAVVVAGFAATQMPAAIASMYAFAASGGIATGALGLFTAAVNIARAATIALGGPIGLVWGLIGAAGAAWLVFGDNASEAEVAMASSKDATHALNSALGIFFQTAAPAAGKAAIDLANDNYKLAASARDAAAAELQKRKAMLASSYEDQLSGAPRGPAGEALADNRSQAALREYEAAIARLTAAETQLDEAYRGRDRAAKAVTGSMSEGMSRTVAETQRLALEIDLTGVSFNDMGDAAGGAGKKAASASDKAAKEAEKLNGTLDDAAKRWREILDPVAKYRRESEELAKLTGRLSGDEMAKAQRNLNIELADSLPLVGEFTDTMTNGLLNGFKGTLSSIGSMLKKWLANMIAMAAKNRIIIGMGMGSTGGAGAAMAAGVPGAGGGVGNMLGSLGGLGALGGSMMAGASGFISALSGGLGPAMQYTQFMAAGATSGMAGLGAAIGAVALPVAAVIAAFTFFRKKIKELDAGLRVTVDGLSTAVDTFSKIETRRFWGLSKKTSTNYERADEETQDALSKIVGTIQTGVLDAAKALGFGAETFADFAHVMNISTKGMSAEDAQRAVQEALGTLGDEFAAMIPGLEALAKDGETTTDALKRLSSALLGVNAIMDTLGHTFHAVGITGADMASKIADAFGGMDAMASATQRFYQTFYSDAERLEVTTRQTTEALAKLGITMPRTRDQYRQMIAALDLTTEKGRTAYAMLIGMSDAFDLMLPKISSLTAEIAALQGAVQTGLDGAISAAQDAAKANATAAASWYKAAGSIREYIDKLRGTASALFNPAQALRYNRQQYNATYNKALGGDLSAAQNVTGAADRYLSSVMDSARTREEAALAQARVLSQLGFLQGTSDIEGARHDVIAGLIGRQGELLQQARDFLANGGVMTAEMIRTLRSGLGSIDSAIAAAQQISVAALMRRLNVTVDVIASADIPPYVRTLLGNATDGVRGFVDFIVRSDLSPDQKWLALAKSSEHLSTINFLAQNRMTPEYTRLALQAGSNYRVAVTSHVASGSALNTAQLQRLFTGSATGQITLGGSFRFDPSTGFATWYETASRTQIATPMAALRTAMGTLQAALIALRTAILTPAAAPVVARPAPAPAPRPPAPAPTGMNKYTFSNANGMVRAVGPLGGVRHYSDMRHATQYLTGANFPNFERGGSHTGGFRIVGEKGPELEATGPSRIFSTSQSKSMLDNSEVVQELRALRAEMAEMQMHARRTAESTRDTFKTLREINSIGVKIDPDQNKVSA